MVFFIDQLKPWKLNNCTILAFVTNEGAHCHLLHSIPTQKLKQWLISIQFLSFCTEDFTAVYQPYRYGVIDSCCHSALKDTKTVLKKIKMTQNGFKLICQGGGGGGGQKVPQASIIVSRTWKMSISRSGTGLHDVPDCMTYISWFNDFVVYLKDYLMDEHQTFG